MTSPARQLEDKLAWRPRRPLAQVEIYRRADHLGAEGSRSWDEDIPAVSQARPGGLLDTASQDIGKREPLVQVFGGRSGLPLNDQGRKNVVTAQPGWPPQRVQIENGTEFTSQALDQRTY